MTKTGLTTERTERTPKELHYLASVQWFYNYACTQDMMSHDEGWNRVVTHSHRLPNIESDMKAQLSRRQS